jgi:hypothetical protein
MAMARAFRDRVRNRPVFLNYDDIHVGINFTDLFQNMSTDAAAVAVFEQSYGTMMRLFEQGVQRIKRIDRNKICRHKTLDGSCGSRKNLAVRNEVGRNYQRKHKIDTDTKHQISDEGHAETDGE